MNSSPNKKTTLKAFLKVIRTDCENAFRQNAEKLNKMSIKMSSLSELVLYLREDGVGLKAISTKSHNWLMHFNRFDRTKGHTGRDLEKNDLMIAQKIIEHILSYDDDKLFAVAEGITIAELGKYADIDKYIKRQITFNQRQYSSKPRTRKQNPVYNHIQKVALTCNPPFTLDELLFKVAKNDVRSSHFADFEYSNVEKTLYYIHGKKSSKISAGAVRSHLRKTPKIRDIMN